MDNEIRLGNMMPLGLFDGKGAGKIRTWPYLPTKVSTGKNKGKTTIIIYGLKAYRENSDLIEREYRRFQNYEQALKEGGVIEQVLSLQEDLSRTASARSRSFTRANKRLDEHFSKPLGLYRSVATNNCVKARHCPQRRNSGMTCAEASMPWALRPSHRWWDWIDGTAVLFGGSASEPKLEECG